MYGAALISRSYAVLAFTLATHLTQMVFLATVETPHIEKIYGAEPVEESDGMEENMFLIHNFDPFRAADVSLVCVSVRGSTVAVAAVADSCCCCSCCWCLSRCCMNRHCWVSWHHRAHRSYWVMLLYGG